MRQQSVYYVLVHPPTGGIVEDKVFKSEDDAIDWWEAHSHNYPEDMDVEVMPTYEYQKRFKHMIV